MSKTTKERFIITFDGSIFRQLKDCCEKKGFSKSVVLQMAFMEYMANETERENRIKGGKNDC